MALTWKRDVPGRQVSACGRYAVASDGYERGYVKSAGDTRRGQEAYDYYGVVGGEWAAVDLTRNDENLDWFPTMREAKAECERHAAAREG